MIDEADEAAGVHNEWRDVGSGDEVEGHEIKLQDEDESEWVTACFTSQALVRLELS